MHIKHAAVVAGLALGLMSGTARAAVVEYLSQAAFNAAAPGLAVHTFTGFDEGVTNAPNPYSYGPLSFFSNDGVNLYNDGDYGNGVNYVAIVGDNAIGSVSLPSGINAVGFTIGSFFGADTVQVSVDGSPQIPVVTTGGDPSTSFIGFTSTTPISSLAFSLESGTELDFISYQVGSSSVSPVPLPASAPMFGAALLGLGLVGYSLKRKGKAAAA